MFFVCVFCVLLCVSAPSLSWSAVSLSGLTVIRQESRVTEAAVVSLFLSFCLSPISLSLCPSDRLWHVVQLSEDVVFTTVQWLDVTLLSFQQKETNIDNTSNDSFAKLVTLCHFFSLYGGDFWFLQQFGCYREHSVIFANAAPCLHGTGSILVRAAQWFLWAMFKLWTFCDSSSWINHCEGLLCVLVSDQNVTVETTERRRGVLGCCAFNLTATSMCPKESFTIQESVGSEL